MYNCKRLEGKISTLITNTYCSLALRSPSILEEDFTFCAQFLSYKWLLFEDLTA